MKDFPAWVRELDDARLAAHFDPATLARGRAYAQQRRVGKVLSAERLLSAQVRGSGYSSYRTTIVLEASGRLSTICSCPVGSWCKHAAALLLQARAAATTDEVPAWQRLLDPLVRPDGTKDGGGALALQFDEDGQGPLIHPLRVGRSGRWIRTGAGWEDIARGDGHLDPDQAAVLARIDAARGREAGYYRQPSARLPLRDCHAGIWELLARAREAGVEFLAGTAANATPLPPPELMADPGEVVIEVRRPSPEPVAGSRQRAESPGGVLVAPLLRVDGATHPLGWNSLQGTPAHGFALHVDGRWLLGALGRPLAGPELDSLGRGPLHVPESDLPLFAAGYLPGLRARFAVEQAYGLHLPEPAPPRLVCRITGDQRRADVTWGFRYELGGRTHDVSTMPRADDPPVRNPAAEADLVATVPPGPWLGARGDRLFGVTLHGAELITFVTQALPRLRANGAVVEQADGMPAFRRAEEAPRILLDVSESTAGDWFDLSLEVAVGDEQVPLGELLHALAVGDDHLILASGTWFPLDSPELERLRILLEEARALVDHDGDTLHLRPEHAGLWDELVGLGVVARQSEGWRRAVGALLDHDALADVAPPAGLRARLRPYQRDGFAWLTFLWRTRLGGILADEMGLGKTLQALALAQAALEAGELGHPLLVVAPTSVLGTWEQEAARFAPELAVTAITETGQRRGQDLAGAIAGANVVLTSYTLLRLEAEEYLAQRWSGVLLDEAQFVKNHASKAYQAVRRLRAGVKIALTGTPLENNLMDLWSLLSITAPGLFPDPKRFTAAYRKPIESGDVDALVRLQRRTRPLMLRRTKAQVAKELPDKQEQVVPVPLTPAHRRIYDRHLARERQKVLGLVGDLDRNRITILRSLTMLRQLSLAPSLVDGAYPEHSAKIEALLEMLDEVISEGHRALVFSQFTSFLALLRKRLAAEGIAHEYLDGRTRDRAARIAAFRGGDAPLFLISLKAGGFGLTLTEADYVFILDPWWNPAAELQAVDRTHRIGQDKPVNVYRLVSEDTIEEKVVALQERKRDLFDAVVGRASDVAAPLSADDIRGLLDLD